MTPDLLELDAARRYGGDVLRALEVDAAHIRATPERVRSVTAPSLADNLGDPAFRRLVVAAWVADLAAYGTPDDQVDLVRLLYVMDTFPAGFRVWFWGDLPVGYTGWYPIAPHTVDLLVAHPEQVEHRGQVVPVRAHTGPIYVFNYSIAAPLRRTRASRLLMRTLADELRAARPTQLAAITVSPEGTRCAERFGMRPVSTITVGASVEQVCVGAPTL